MTNIQTIEQTVTLQLQIIALLWQRLQTLTPSHMPSYRLGERYMARAQNAATLAVETYRDEKDRWNYVRWLGEYIVFFSQLIENETTAEKLKHE